MPDPTGHVTIRTTTTEGENMFTSTFGNRLRTIGAALVAATVLTACGGGATQADRSPNDGARNDVVVAIATEPEGGFDPTVGWGHGTTPLIQSTLVEYTQDMRIVNDLATDQRISDDGLTWRFTLRDDASFTDGKPVTAHDVEFTFTTAKAKASSLDLTFMTGCKATSDREVEFTLAKPNSSFLNTIATIGIVPKHAYGKDYANNPIGSGPWKFVQWKKGEQVTLAANDSYYGTKPSLDKVTLVFMDEDAAFAAAKARQVDVALTSATQATQDITGMRLEVVSTLDNRGLTLPVSPSQGKLSKSGEPVGNDVTSNLAIRQALAFAVNRDQIAKDAVNGFAAPAFSENDGMPWNNPEVKITEDVAHATSVLTADGWKDTDGDGILDKNGVKAEFTLLYSSGDSVRQAIAMAVAQQVKSLGIRINVEGAGWDQIVKRMFVDAVLMGWGSTNPYTSYLLFHSSNALKDDFYNPQGFSNPVVDQHLETALHATSPEEANVAWRLAQWDDTTGTSMRAEIPWVWLVNLQHLYYVADGLDIGQQQLHGHGASWTLLQNLRDWSWR